MRLYLMRHAEAEPEALAADDSQRRLTEHGEGQALAMGEFLHNYGVHVSQLMHSGKLRAEQTADLVAKAITLTDAAQVDPGLTGDEGLTPMIDKINGWSENTLIVSHLPFISRLLSRLLVNDPSAKLVGFVPATIISLEQVESADWRMRWCVNPSLVAAMQNNSRGDAK